MKKQFDLNKSAEKFFYLIRNTKYFLQRERAAFTLIELLIVVAITTVISVAGVTTFLKYRNSQNLKLSTSEVATAMRGAARRSVTQQDGKQWAIRLSNTTSTQRFELWGGTSYASGTISDINSLRNGIKFGNPTTSSTLDLVFSAITGALSGNTVVTLNDGGGDGLVGDIVADTLGKITVRNDKGLVGYWHFDENTSSTAYDASGSRNNGVLYGSPTWASGSSCKAGSCLGLNGSTQYADIGTPGNYSDNFSLSAWVKHANTSGWDDIISGGCGDFLFAFNGTTFQFGGQCNVPFGMTTYSGNIEGAWHYVAATYDGSTVTLYVDGVAVNSAPKSGVFVPGHLYIGGGSSERFLGSVDEVRIYNRALSAQEILDQYDDLK